MPSIPQITIDQQLAEIGVRSTPAQMHIAFPRLQMKITTESPHMQIDSKSPSFKVNRKKINAESGLKSPSEVTTSFRDSGKAAALQGARTAKEDGNFLGELRIPGDRVAKLAHNKSLAAVLKKKQTNIGLMPKSSPQVEWDKGYMRINWSKHSIVIDWDGDYMPQLTVDPKYSIEVYLRTEPYFKIMITGGEDPNMPGKLVDEAI